MNKIKTINNCILTVNEIIKLQEEKLDLLKKHKKGLEQLLKEEECIKN